MRQVEREGFVSRDAVDPSRFVRRVAAFEPGAVIFVAAPVERRQPGALRARVAARA
jgi:hypothetical protein